MFPTQRHLDGSTYYALAGPDHGRRLSGQCHVSVAPTALRLDQWVAVGKPGLDLRALPAVHETIESDQDFPDSPIHGKDGPFMSSATRLSTCRLGTGARLSDAAYAMGLPQGPDVNVPEPYGVCASPYNIKEGKRQSTTIAYLNPVRDRPNLTIIAEARCIRSTSGKKAEGVRYEKDGQIQTVLGGQILTHIRRLWFAANSDALGIGSEAETEETRDSARS